ncbi:bcl-2-like protein 13 isoform X1 [Astyanax mexicanus]|uniref:BCL2 like 13 n=1 Tax=Astyanax mexicanus TaxID=7994 RepID=W5JYR3_ASTMX|nr:bcl-2-like protein 13 isoform X1 [Astyanax mexicanus]XP_015463022.2 bcl-2-like protein 13 isoform X1 [Astyanax mexicanus]XP_015463023.2 bcl-2-like protein 13 isoform X1 [Astyanax mexicanus]
MAASGSSTTVPEGFHYETKYVLLSYLSLPPSSHSRPAEAAAGQTAQEKDVDQTSRMKQEIEEELKLLEEEITASFPRTGFDRHTSPVFSPANPESSIEDSLAVLGDRVTRDLDTHLASAMHTLLSGQLDYESFRTVVQEVSAHSQGGWSKVLVPLVLLQALQAEGQPLASLLALGVFYLEETEADFIIQQGGWSAVFSLEDVDDPGVIIAEDSNDIYILSGEQAPELLSPPESLLITADSSGPGSWQTESLPVSLTGHESWAQVGMMDPEDAKSLDSAEGMALAEERSENNSSNSDIVHVEREEAELLEEGREPVEEEGLQESVLSVLGSESELAALRAELREEATPSPAKVPELLESPEDSIVIMEAPVSLAAPVPESAFALQPESLVPPAPPVVAAAAPVPAAAAPVVPDPQPEPQTSQPEPVLAPVEPQLPISIKEPLPAIAPIAEPEAEPEPVQALPDQEPPAQEPVVLQEVQAAPAPAQEPPVLSQAAVQAQAEPAHSELPVLLYGGAALVAIAALVAYGALAYRKK